MKKKIVAGMCALVCACLFINLVYSDNFYQPSREEVLKIVDKYINDKNNKITPQHLLIKAILDNNLEGLKKALEKGANVNFKQDNKKPLFFLVKRDEQDLSIDNFEGENENLEQEEIRIEQQELQEFEEGAELTDEAKAQNFFEDLEEGITPLGIAAEYSTPEIVEYLLQSDANPNKSDNQGLTPLMMAVLHERSDETSDPEIAIINLLLKFGANVNARNYYGNPGYTALYYTIGTSEAYSEMKDYDAIAVMNALIKGGANVNLKYSNGETLLHFANNPKELLTLLQADANPHIQDNNGDTPLISQIGFDLQDDPTRVSMLLKVGADPNRANNNGETPLIQAIDCKLVNIIEALLEGGANPQLLDEEYRNKLNDLRFPKNRENE